MAGFCTAYSLISFQYEVNINLMLPLSKVRIVFVISHYKTSYMNWKTALTNGEHEMYELWHGEKKLLSLEFHPFTNSARIQYADTKRVFLLRKEGFLRNKTVLRNEYGIRIGQLGYDKSRAAQGMIELNDKKFSFALQNNPLAELVIRSEEENKPLVVCGLSAKTGRTSVELNKQLPLSNAEHFLLMALCWYLFLPVAKDNVVEYAL